MQDALASKDGQYKAYKTIWSQIASGLQNAGQLNRDLLSLKTYINDVKVGGPYGDTLDGAIEKFASTFDAEDGKTWRDKVGALFN